MTRITCFAVLMWFTAVTAVSGNEYETAADRGIVWLLKQQADDGGWHSEVYANLRSGCGTTALVLAAIAESRPDENSPQMAAFRSGLAFLTTATDSTGLVCAPDGSVDSPVYATALVLSASERLSPLSSERRQQLVDALLRGQQTAANGWPDDTSGRGGWGIVPRPESAESAPANVSVTVHVLAALAAVKQPLPADVQNSVMLFLQRCRNQTDSTERGFFFTPDPEDQLNKAGSFKTDDGTVIVRTYRPATADGLSSLLLCGYRPGQPEVVAAMRALRDQLAPELLMPPIDRDAIAGPLSGLFFYDAAALGRACEQTSDPELASRRESCLKTLVAAQHADGSWSNPVSWMREDDPLIATALAVLALSRFHEQGMQDRPFP